jgi:ribosomal-protein-alanine N-acetyltransferase
MIFHTTRLQLSPIALSDAVFYLELVNQQSWVSMIGSHELSSIEAVEGHIENILVPHFYSFGYGFYVMRLAACETPIGICGITNRQGFAHPDLGFALLDRYTRMGYVHEACACLLTELPKQMPFKVIQAIALPHNHASKNVLFNLQFSPVKRIQLPGSKEWLQLFEKRINGVL